MCVLLLMLLYIFCFYIFSQKQTTTKFMLLIRARFNEEYLFIYSKIRCFVVVTIVLFYFNCILRSLFRALLITLFPLSQRLLLVKQTNWFGQCQCYCVIEAGPRVVGKTRPQKLTAQLSWEQPEERFRLPISPLTNASTTTTGEAGEPGAMMARSDGDNNCQQPHDDEPALPPPGCDNPIISAEPALSPGCDSLTISVWSKRTIGGSQELLGTATVPTHYIDHPPGDVRLDLLLQDNAKQGDAAPPAEGLNRQHSFADYDAGGAEEQQRGGKKPSKLFSVSNKRGKGGGSSSWGGGFFKTLRGTKTSKGGWKGKEGRHGGRPLESIGSVHVWLGKAVRSSASGQRPGKEVVTLRVHAAAGLWKV